MVIIRTFSKARVFFFMSLNAPKTPTNTAIKINKDKTTEPLEILLMNSRGGRITKGTEPPPKWCSPSIELYIPSTIEIICSDKMQSIVIIGGRITLGNLLDPSESLSFRQAM